MKYSYDQTLLVLILLGWLSHAEALSSYNYIPGENGVIIETTTGQVTIPVRDDVITPNSSVYINGTTLQIIYKGGNTVSVINTDTNFLEAGFGFIKTDTPDSIDGNFFTLNIKIGSGSDTQFLSKLPSCISPDKPPVKIKGTGSGTVRTRPEHPRKPHKCRPIDGDFFTLGVRINIKIGSGSGTVKTPQNLYSGDQCVETPCQETHPVGKLIIFTATPDVGSSLTEWDCGDETTVEMEEKGHYCFATFDLIPPLDSAIFSTSTTTTSATLAGGIFIEGNPPKKNIELSSSQVDIKGLITAEPEHIGQTVDIIVVASHVPPESDAQTWYMRDGETGVEFLDVNNLLAFKKNIRLAETQHVELYRGQLFEGLWQMHFGYRLMDGTLIYNSEPITIRITP